MCFSCWPRVEVLENAMRQLISAITRRIFQPTETLEGYDEPDLVEVIFQKSAVFARGE